MQEKVNLDYNLFYNESNFDDLKQAVETLTSATESQFESIKNEKWYTRLFDCITFSKKNEKRMASQISNLAQAQQILVEMLVRFSARDAEIAKLVNQNYESIIILAQNDICLGKNIKRIENIHIYGVSVIPDIRDLSNIGKQALSASLYNLSEIYGEPSENQQDYANNLLNYIGTDATIENLSAVLENELDEKERYSILSCCMEYIFLYNADLNEIDESVNEFIDLFDIGKKSIDKIKNTVIATFDLRGPNGIINKYQVTDDFDMSGFLTEVPDDFEDEEETESAETTAESSLSDDMKLLKIINECEAYKRGTIETKNYFFRYIDYSWTEPEIICYDKNTGENHELSSIKNTSFERFTFDTDPNRWTLKTTVYSEDLVYYVINGVLYQLNLATDTLTAFADVPLSEIKYHWTMKANKDYFIFEANNELFCYDIKNNKFTQITDCIGTKIRCTSCENIGYWLNNNKVYFNIKNGDELINEEGQKIGNCICEYNIKTKKITQLIEASSDARVAFCINDKIFLVKYYPNALFVLFCEDGKYQLKEIAKTAGIYQLFPNCFSWYSSDTSYNDKYAIYVFNFKNQIIKKVINDCYTYEDTGVFKHNWKRISFYHYEAKIIGNWLYYRKDRIAYVFHNHHTSDELRSSKYRVNIEKLGESVDVGEIYI